MVWRWLAGARTVITVAVLLAAGVFVLTTLVTRRRLIRAEEIRSVLSMGGPVTGNALRDVLRTLTGDPDLDVYYRLPNREEYVTSDGGPAPGRDRIGATATRQLIGAGTVDEQGFTALVETAAPADRAARTLRRAVLEAATPALENARLQATLRRQVLDLVSSRSRTVRAFLAERRRLEGQLHDGTQACLYETAIRAILPRRLLARRAWAPPMRRCRTPSSRMHQSRPRSGRIALGQSNSRRTNSVEHALPVSMRSYGGLGSR